MKLKIFILSLLCVAVLLPSIVTAQEFDIFAKQKVVVADIRDMNDRHLSDGVKQCIRQGIIDACTKSSDYEVYEINIEDIKRQLTASGQKVSFPTICNAIGKRADYIIFTNVKLSSSEVGAQNITIYLTSSLYRIATGSEMKTRFAEAAPTSSSILSATSKLVSELLGINISVQSQSSQGIRSSTSYQQSYQQPAHSQPVQPIEKSYKVGDLYDVNGKQGVVYVVTPDGKHGKMVSINKAPGETGWLGAKSWCSSLGGGWRLPTKEELLVIYRNKGVLNAVLAAVGEEILYHYHWSSTEDGSDCAWSVRMSNGYTYSFNKYKICMSVRAVSAF